MSFEKDNFMLPPPPALMIQTISKNSINSFLTLKQAFLEAKKDRSIRKIKVELLTGEILSLSRRKANWFSRIFLHSEWYVDES